MVPPEDDNVELLAPGADTGEIAAPSCNHVPSVGKAMMVESSGHRIQLPLLADGDLTPETGARPLETCAHLESGKLTAVRRRVISASKRTDIPAFYLSWFLGRVEAGWVDVPNPMFRYASDPLKRLSHLSLRPEHVQAIVWWSKNYAVYERVSERLTVYSDQYFQFTINPRRADLAWIEPDVPPLDEALRQVRFLAGLPGGPSRIAWRYDPLLFWREDGADRNSWDPDFFGHVARALGSIGVTRCFTSVADRYAKFEKRMRQSSPDRSLRDPTTAELTAISTEMAALADAHELDLFSCTEAALAACEGFTKGACIDGRLLGGPKAAATDTKMRGREECGCTLHTDIGDYVTQECGYSCVYCYANPNHRRFAVNVSGRPLKV
jgi:hypothetical protein